MNTSESVKIDKAIVQECRKLAKREGRTLKGLMGLLLRMAINSRGGQQ